MIKFRIKTIYSSRKTKEKFYNIVFVHSIIRFPHTVLRIGTDLATWQI